MQIRTTSDGLPIHFCTPFLALFGHQKLILTLALALDELLTNLVRLSGALAIVMGRVFFFLTGKLRF